MNLFQVLLMLTLQMIMKQMKQIMKHEEYENEMAIGTYVSIDRTER